MSYLPHIVIFGEGGKLCDGEQNGEKWENVEFSPENYMSKSVLLDNRPNILKLSEFIGIQYLHLKYRNVCKCKQTNLNDKNA